MDYLSGIISFVPSESWGFLKGGTGPPLKLRRRRRVKRFRRNARSFKWVWASARKRGAEPRPAQSIWQGSSFAADQTNAMLATSNGGDKSSRKRKPLRLLGTASFAENLPFTAEKQDVSSAGFQGIFLPSHSAILTFLCGGITTLGVCFMLSKRWARRGQRWLNSSLPCTLSPSALRAHTAAYTGKHGGRFILSVTA